MKRFGQLTIGLVLVAVWSAQAAQAQTTDGKWSLQADAAATLGHASSSSFGGEVDRRLSSAWSLALEGGAMRNITSSGTQGRADLIGAQIGATGNPIQKAVYYDLGLRYHLMPDGKWNPYVTVGFGGARVTTTTTFASGGVTLTPDQLAAKLVALGADLDGHIMKPFLVAGAGVDLPIKQRYFIGGSVRYGLLFPRSSEIDGDKSTSTIRVQIGLGVRF